MMALDDGRPTPAVACADGVDFVPTRPFYLFAQHFSAIAAAGPIAGPILACQTFGWVPCLLWIGVGVVTIGAVHDFVSLAASVRHRGHSIADIARAEIGPRSGVAMMVFIWIALVYVIVAFTDITSGSFVSATEELSGLPLGFNPGGAVAAASVLYLLLAIVMGVVDRCFAPSLAVQTAIFVPATFALAWFGTKISTLLLFEPRTWSLLILAYCAIASLVPVWMLLQPRGYLGGFVLFFVLAVGTLGVFCGGYEIRQPAFKAWDAGGATGALFPFLFVTIACGACSGFHGLVCSGTTSKQVEAESHMQPIGYGAMLAEGFVAFIALVTIMIAAPEVVKSVKPGRIYGNGIGEFMTLFLGKENLVFAVTFGAMAFSTFVFDTLDVCTRLGRMIVTELMGWKGTVGALLGTAVTIAPPVAFALLAPPGSWAKFWTLFGASNQLLAALSLLVLTVWLRREGRPTLPTLLPMAFVMTITLWALGRIVLSSLGPPVQTGIEVANGVSALVLILLALFLAHAAFRKGLRNDEGVMPHTPTIGSQSPCV